MTVTQQTPVNTYTANGISTVFNFTFLLLSANDLDVYVNNVLKTVGSEYTVSGLDSASGGTVTFAVAPVSGANIVLQRNSDIARQTDYQDNGDMLAQVVNADFDRLWLVMQEVLYRYQLAPSLPPGSLLAGHIRLPSPETGKYLRWNALANNLENTGAPIIVSTVELWVSTFADLANTAATVEIVQTRGHTVSGLGSRKFLKTAGSVVSDGGTQINSATPGFYWKVTNLEFYSPEMFGCISTSTAIETTRAINKAYVAANATGKGVVRFEQLNYSIDGIVDGLADVSSFGTRGGIQIKSNTITEFTGQTFTQVATSSNNYSLVNCSNASNFVIRGQATFIGEALIHIIGTGGEWGHGLYLANAHNFEVSGLTIKTCWGDGCYFSNTDESTAELGISTSSSNGVVRDCIFDGNRRQGTSGVNGQSVTFQRCQFINTGRAGVSTPLGAGVDLEPDASPNSLGLRRITFEDCLFDNNAGPNFEVFPNIVNGCIDIELRNCKLLTCYAQGSYWSDRPATNVKNVVVNGGVILGGIYHGNGTTFNNVKIIRSMADPGASSYVIEAAASSFDAVFNNCEIRASGDTTVNSKKFLFYPAGITWDNRFKFNYCRFIAENVYGGATNILFVVNSEIEFNKCDFLTEGASPASYIGFDSTSGSSKMVPAFANIDDCYFASDWHGTVTNLKGRVSYAKELRRIREVTYSATNQIPVSQADTFIFNFTGTSAVAMAAPTDSFRRTITIVIKNTSAGALGVLTWDAIYKLSAWIQPAAGFSRAITFEYNGTNWVERFRTPADVPN